MKKPITPDMPKKFKEEPPKEVLEVIFEHDLGWSSWKDNGREISVAELLEDAQRNEPSVELKDLFFRGTNDRWCDDRSKLQVGFRIPNLHYEKQLQEYNERKTASDNERAEYNRLMSEHAKERIAFEVYETEEKLEKLKKQLEYLKKED